MSKAKAIFLDLKEIDSLPEVLKWKKKFDVPVAVFLKSVFLTEKITVEEFLKRAVLECGDDYSYSRPLPLLAMAVMFHKRRWLRLCESKRINGHILVAGVWADIDAEWLEKEQRRFEREVMKK